MDLGKDVRDPGARGSEAMGKRGLGGPRTLYACGIRRRGGPAVWGNEGVGIQRRVVHACVHARNLEHSPNEFIENEYARCEKES